jgi:hypothetical protein
VAKSEKEIQRIVRDVKKCADNERRHRDALIEYIQAWSSTRGNKAALACAVGIAPQAIGNLLTHPNKVRAVTLAGWVEKIDVIQSKKS